MKTQIKNSVKNTVCNLTKLKSLPQKMFVASYCTVSMTRFFNLSKIQGAIFFTGQFNFSFSLNLAIFSQLL